MSKSSRTSEETSQPTESITGTGTVVRVVRLLGALADVNGDVSLGELAERIGLPASTVHRLLDLLAGEGMVERDDALRLYRPGLEFFRMAASIYSRKPIHGLALPFLRDAVSENDENAYLGMLDSQAGKMLFAAVAESTNLLSYRVELNEMLSLVRGSSGLAMLAWMRDEDRDRVLAMESQAGLLNAKERTALLASLAVIREQGYALTFGQRIRGAVGIFAPIFNAQSRVVGSLGYTVPEIRYHADDLPKLSEAVMRYAGALSSALGYRNNDLQLKNSSRSDKGNNGRHQKNLPSK
ncbi:MAG TPA: IclR family transcriptional regulator [Herbaspirillum sp.]|jgi:DNA-binding IclR family transcriptional regulator